MKTVAAVVATVALLSTPAFASTSLKFVGANNNVETQVCVAAAEQGLKAADKAGKKLGLSKSETRSLLCNGQTITAFSQKVKSTEVASTKVYSL